MTSLFHYTSKTDHVGNSLEDFYQAIEDFEESFKKQEITLGELLGKIAGLLSDKTTGDLRDRWVLEKATRTHDKLLALAVEHELGPLAETWFVVELLSYRLGRTLGISEAFYKFVEENAYLAPRDAINNFDAIIKSFHVVPARMVRILCANYIFWSGTHIQFQDFERILASTKDNG
ncbi:hypothetical protein HNQ36_003457 [Afipia massiliensis]|uniref:Uncharacterized protein n=1 Tax=Afipia massiliensis TaxID=211460 RepID=A0A840N9T8_9BRAD|nr:hypothetical protein [Afipia massiliensis]MBB5053466.1 hypothetical protein [Afipia massiliensis]